MGTMGVGASTLLVAIGAILAFAVNASVSGLELETVGVILMIAGAVGFLVSLIVGFGNRGTTTTVVDDAPVIERVSYR